jgi:hypothetical protein
MVPLIWVRDLLYSPLSALTTAESLLLVPVTNFDKIEESETHLEVEAALNSGVLIEEVEIDARLFMAEVTQLDGLLKQYVDYLIGDSVLTMNRMLASRCKKRLVKRFKAYDPNVPVSEIRA